MVPFPSTSAASINCLTSDSEILEPCLARPIFNSSKVIVPLLSVSILLNISFRPIISSSDRLSAITFKATFLSLFIALNCFILFNTALSIGLSGASPSSLIHGWLRTWRAEIRSFGSCFNIFPTRSFALLDMDGHGAVSKSTCPSRTASNIPRSVSAQKGGTPLRRIYSITPALQTSASCP
eukprot:Gb_00925 [translate_table: standard]